MESLAIFGFTFGVFGMIAFTRLYKLEKHLKETGVLEKDYK
jgi:hypothetical protein